MQQEAKPEQENDYSPKSRTLALELRREILEGRYAPGDCLPPIIEIMRARGLSRTVVQCAHKILAAEGLIICERGRGTFVADYEGGDRRLGQIALIRNNIQQAGYDYARTVLCNEFALPCTAIDIISRGSCPAATQGLSLLRPRGLCGVAIDLDSTTAAAEDAIRWGEGLPVLFVHRYEWSPVPPANAILLDFTSAYIAAARFLLGRGAKRILFLGGHDAPPEYLRQRIEATAAAAGMKYPSDRFRYLSHTPISSGDLPAQAELLRRAFPEDAPETALIGMGDYPVFQILQLYRMCFPGRKLPDATGMYNTDWSVQPGCAFHTFFPCWTQLWREALERLCAPETIHTAPSYIVPKLIAR